MSIKALFSIYQTENYSNGGVSSMTQILEEDSAVTPYILTNRIGPFNKRWDARGWKVFVSNIKWGSALSTQGKVGKIIDLAKSNFLAFKLLIKYKLPILYCNDVQGFWCAYFGGKMAGVKIIFNLRDTKSADEFASLKKWAYIARKSDVIIVLSAEMKDFVVTQLLDNRNHEKVYVTYSIVNQEIFRPAEAEIIQQKRAELGISENDFVVSYIAAFNSKKAQLPFIQQVIARFKNEPHTRFYFIGDFNPQTNPYARQCLDAVNQLGIMQQVTFVGHDSQVDKWYKISNLVAIASTKEGLARCMIESISCGTPVVSFDVCSAKEILEEHQCGEVVAIGDYQAFYEKIKLLMVNNALINIYKLNGIKLSGNLFNKAVVLKKYQFIYSKIHNLA